MASEPVLVLLLLASTLVDYYCGLKMDKLQSKDLKRKYLVISILSNVGILIAFKYLFFFIDSLNTVLSFFGVDLPSAEKVQGYSINQILLPVGISFYTFQTMSYTIEVYRGRISAERHLGRFALYVAYFPQLVAGPIEKATRLLPQFRKEIKADLQQIRQGLILMAWGFFLKVVVADRLGLYVDLAYSDPEAYSGLPLILAAFFFAFQIYFDFSAYTAIAIGAAKTMGISLMDNFNRPLFASSIRQFWQRWHISLTQWIRDYLYFPLRKNLKATPLLSVSIVFFVMGLWHGANWTFVVWGLLNGAYLVVETFLLPYRKLLFKKLGLQGTPSKILGWSAAFVLIVFSLIFFRSPTIQDAFLYIRHLFSIQNLHFNILNNYFELIISILLILGVQIVHYFKGNSKVYELVISQSVSIRWLIYLTYILFMVLFAINRQNTFIYFQF
nr:MBOAT family O-acyltransferase [Allomuricauda sp.]